MSQRVLVVGDVAFDWFEQTVRPADLVGDLSKVPNHAVLPGFSWSPTLGGAWLLTRMVREAVGALTPEPQVFGHSEINPYAPTARHHLHSLTRLSPRRDGTLGVEAFRGFTIPDGNRYAAIPDLPQLPGEAAEVVIVDDAANGCRWDGGFVAAVDDHVSHARLVILKLNRPLDVSPFLDWRPRAGRRTVTVVNADDLRAHGVDISRRLSWERTAIDLLRAAETHPVFRRLATIGQVLVRLGCDGCFAIAADAVPRLVFDPTGAEGSFVRQIGGLPGETSAFVASLVASWLAQPPGTDEPNPTAALPAALQASRRLHEIGFVSRDGHPDYPLDLWTAPMTSFIVKALPAGKQVRPGWSILSDALQAAPELPQRIVMDGSVSTLAAVPTALYKDLLLADQQEIEGYRAIENLLREYLVTTKPPPRPLSIGLFGPPGSGKSFGIKQLASAVGGVGAVPIVSRVINLTQLERPRELVGIFHEARDTGLRGDLPMLIFDEFDCLLDGKEFGWVKHFLAPMQEGEFIDEGRLHPLGRSILVFAGGIAHSYDKLGQRVDEEDADFAAVKGPDFVSRLKGHLDILGINPRRHQQVDPELRVRRAMLLRALLLQQSERTAAMFPIIDGHKRFQVDRPVLEAFLGVTRYHHGVRSLEALLAMSQLSGRSRFEVACLPPDGQLLQHVDESFMKSLRAPPSSRAEMKINRRRKSVAVRIYLLCGHGEREFDG